MKPLRPLLILILGPMGLCLAIAGASLLITQDPEFRWVGVITGVLFSVSFGLPFFGGIAFVSRWYRKEQAGSPEAILSHYRKIDAVVRSVGFSSVGYVAGCGLTCYATWLAQGSVQVILGVACGVLFYCCMCVLIVVALLKGALIQRAEAIKAQIAAQESRNAESDARAIAGE